MTEDVTIHFDCINGSWMWTLSKGKYRAQGVGASFEHAESSAYEVAEQLPNVGIIHVIYDAGRPVPPSVGKIKDAFVEDFIHETFDKQED